MVAQDDLEAAVQSGVAALRRGDARAARDAFERVAAAGRGTPQLWLLLAQSCAIAGDDRAAHEAVDRVLSADRTNLHAMLMKGDLLARAGDDRAASSWYDAALRAAARAGPLPPDLAERLKRAEAANAHARSRYKAHLEGQLAAAGVDSASAGKRFREAIDILSGTARPYFQEPTSFFFPGLPQIAFYDADRFAWVKTLEAAVPQIRAEVEAVLTSDHGLTPYVERPKNRPAKAHSLLDDARWSAFHLWRDGEPVEANAARCPATLAALADAPIPRIRGRSPMVLFSILKGGTHIPPHNGMLNTRLICHIPLIVPPDCALRVGNETREVEEGRALLFDDSIEHEAWNRSDRSRAILLFEVWRPELSPEERAALTAMFEAVNTYPAGEG